MSHQPTDEQLAVIDAIRQPSSNVMVEAYAGAAKTTTLEMASSGVKVPALAVAFGKRNATEMQRRLPGNFSVKTFNGLGHGAWVRSLPAGTKLVLDDRKLGKLVTQVARDNKVELSVDQWDQLRQVVTLAQQAGIVPFELGTGLLPDDEASWVDGPLDSAGVFPDDLGMMMDLARQVLAADIAMAKAGTISFDDQIYCPTMLGAQFPRFPLAFVDESQDLSPMNHLMLAKATRPDARLVVVGDSRQAIYAWRGADADSMANLKAMRPEWTTLPLATSFRCPHEIASRQEAHAPGFKAFHTNPQGLFRRFPAPVGGLLAEDDFQTWQWLDVQVMADKLGPASSIVVLCRNNAPLMTLAMRLIRQRVGLQVLGRDIGKGLVVLARRLAPDDGLPVDSFLGLVRDWEDSEVSKARANGREEKLASLHDRADCLRALADGVRDVGELCRVCERLFSKEGTRVVLSSIHLYKGMEADVVVHLDSWRIPSKFARQLAKEGDDRQLIQEHNLKYVAETRTRHTLINANLEDFQ